MTDEKIIKYTGMTLEEIQELREELAKEFAFTPWGRVDENHQIFRFVTSFMTKPESVDRLIEML